MSGYEASRSRNPTPFRGGGVNGYVAGGVPPFPHDDGIGLYHDISLTTYPRVWAAAGEQNAVMQISVKELIETIGGAVVDVTS